MATTTHTDGSNGIPPQAELDKLGPIGAKASVLGDDGELRGALIEEFLAAAEAARDAAASVDRGASKAVHAYRKALRRARAVLSLVAAALPKTERSAVKKALQEARRSVSAVRDHAVAPDTLASLTLGDDDRHTANAVLAKAAEAMPPVVEIKQRLADGAARAVAQVEALEAALPHAIEIQAIVAGVEDVYREARRARRGAKKDTQEFHTWRRRTKELVYQLEIVAQWAGERVSTLHHIYEGVADAMSPAVDLIMLRDFVETHGQGLGKDALEHLTIAIEAQLDDTMRDARKASRDAFERSGKQLRKKVRRAVRKDIEPTAQATG